MGAIFFLANHDKRTHKPMNFGGQFSDHLISLPHKKTGFTVVSMKIGE